MSARSTGIARDRRAVRAEEDGRAWADDVRLALLEDGRPAAGGWPGTLSEARARAADAMGEPGAKPTPDERERLARILYHAARDFWLTRRDPTPPDED